MMTKIEYLVQHLFRKGMVNTSEAVALLAAIEHCSADIPAASVEKFGNQIVEGFASLNGERRFFNVGIPKD